MNAPLTDAELQKAMAQQADIAALAVLLAASGRSNPLRTAVISVTGSDEHAPPVEQENQT